MSAPAPYPEVLPLILDLTDQAPKMARDFVAKRFCDLGIADDYVARAVVSEFVTNVCVHVKIGQIDVRVFEDPQDGRIVIEVADEGGGIPVVQEEDNDAESGRGLLLVDYLVHDWGVRPTNEGKKIIWAKLDR